VCASERAASDNWSSQMTIHVDIQCESVEIGWTSMTAKSARLWVLRVDATRLKHGRLDTFSEWSVKREATQ